jgi:hypothetical protein
MLIVLYMPWHIANFEMHQLGLWYKSKKEAPAGERRSFSRRVATDPLERIERWRLTRTGLMI